MNNSINLPPHKPKQLIAAPSSKPGMQTSYNKGYSLIKRQKSNDYSNENPLTKTKPEKIVQTPSQKKTDFDSNSETDSEITSNLDIKKGEKIRALILIWILKISHVNICIYFMDHSFIKYLN